MFLMKFRKIFIHSVSDSAQRASDSIFYLFLLFQQNVEYLVDLLELLLHLQKLLHLFLYLVEVQVGRLYSEKVFHLSGFCF